MKTKKNEIIFHKEKDEEKNSMKYSYYALNQEKYIPEETLDPETPSDKILFVAISKIAKEAMKIENLDHSYMAKLKVDDSDLPQFYHSVLVKKKKRSSI